MPLSRRSASSSIRSPYPEDAPSESTIYTFLCGNFSFNVRAARRAALYVPEIPEERETYTTSLPSSSQGVNACKNSSVFVCEVRVIAPRAMAA